MPRRTLSAENAADLYSPHLFATDLGAAARNMLVAAAALLGEDANSKSSDQALRERLEQKLWEASVDGLIADDQKKKVEEIRKYLLDSTNM